MSKDFLKPLLREEQALLQGLANNPLFQRLEAVRKLIELYRREPEQPQQGGLPFAPLSSDEPRRVAFAPGAGKSLSGTIVEIALDYMRKTNRRAKSGEIVTEVERRGHPIPGAKKSARVASALSASPMFDNKEGQGYGLKEWSLRSEEEESKAASDLTPDAA